MLAGDVGGLHLEDPGPDEPVQVLARPERLDQPVVAGQVRHDPHLDLAVVGGHQRLVAVADDERLADPAALLGADRDVLQVGVGGGQPPGRRDGLDVGRVDPAVVGDRLEQPLDGDPQPGGVAVAQQRLEERVLGLARTGRCSASASVV